eukprot:CAMPEP_0185821600 /NCGR_PEP_ID=MMETSP1322-20130828/25462_1 /TAXON_ID=265543 /ORGANISM="Minutocellus polymorphus, Strain RCC2270" /LENGTH=38 /DNA_ID= /DNA_START= /DNA_END= /DNA_ORIENTATION=
MSHTSEDYSSDRAEGTREDQLQDAMTIKRLPNHERVEN